VSRPSGRIFTQRYIELTRFSPADSTCRGPPGDQPGQFNTPHSIVADVHRGPLAFERESLFDKTICQTLDNCVDKFIDLVNGAAR
jgi:hypothetical protein